MTEETPQDSHTTEDGHGTAASTPPRQPVAAGSTGNAATDDATGAGARAATAGAGGEAAGDAPAPEAQGGEVAALAESPEAAAVADGGQADAPAESAGDAEPVADGGEATAGVEEAAHAAEGSEAGAAGKKKRRRRRKKKAAAEAKAGGHEGVLTRFLGERAARRHTVHDFAVGEVVAGRVERVADHAIVLDLFGKGMASVDECEPREVPELPEPLEDAAQTAAGDRAAETSGELTEDGRAGASAEATLRAESDGAAVPKALRAAEGVREPAESVAATESAQGEGAADAPAVGSGELPAAADSAPVESVESEAGLSEDQAGDAGPDSGAAAGDDREPEAAAAEPAGPPPESQDPEGDPPPPPAVGSIFRGRIAGVAESGHIALVNRLIDRRQAKAFIAHARDHHQRVSGLVYGFNRGGFDVIVQGIRVFCPASGMSLSPIEDPTAFLGKKLDFGLPAGKTGRSIIVSRRGILEREARKQARARMAELKPGQRLKGVVTQVREFGVLVDVGDGLEGLVHMSELSWSRGARPADLAKPGDEVEVEVLKVQLGNRKDRYGKLSLSVKACLPDPLEQHADLVKVGTAMKGKVTSTTDFGAFVELAPGVEGLLHISELGRELKHASQVLNVGDEVDVVVERIDRDKRRVSLSRLSAADAEAIERGEIDPTKAPRSLKPGAHVKVVVERVDRRGLKVQVEGVLGKRGRGFIAARELGSADQDRRQPIGVGTILEVKITGTDRSGALRCSVRGKEQDEERQAVRSYRKEAAQQGFGTFGDLLRAKLGGDEGG